MNTNYLTETALQISNNSVVKSVFGWWNGDSKYGTYMYNAASHKYLGIKDDGTPHYHGNTLWHSGNLNPSNYLPLSGGTLSGSTAYILTISRTSSTPLIALQQDGALCGFLGVTKESDAVFYDNNGTMRYLIHSANIGSYNAGSATKLQTARTIWGKSFDGTGNVSGSIQLDDGELLMTSSNHWGASAWRLFSYGPTLQILYGDGYNTASNTSAKFNNDGSINVNKLITYEGTNSRYSIFDANGLSCFTTSTGGYAVGVGIHAYDGSFSYPLINAYGSGSTLNYIFIGGAYNNPWVKIDTSANMLVKGGITMYGSSDKRLKKNIRTFKASEELMKLGGVYQFEYNDDEIERNNTYKGTHVGLIYQNVKGTILDKMCYEREDGYGALNYLDSSFISLIAAVGIEHETRLQKLERENKELRAEVERLKSA